jgi:tetratricopeptide (TPR) repeat protein
LAVQKKYQESIDVYLKAYNKRKDDLDIIEFLADLTYQIKYYKKSLKFIKLFLKQNPRNSEKLKMKAFCQETL